MKRVFSSMVLLAMTMIVNAQKSVPSFGKVDIEDLKMTECSFDPGAEAINLIDIGNVWYDRGVANVTLFKTMYNYRTRIKILKEKGMSYANVELPFYSFKNDERIVSIEANTYNLDENGKVKITPVSKSSIYTKKINKRISRVVIAFPDVKVGSIIEYKYKLERETWTNLKDWYFQSSLPTSYSEYQFEIPLIVRFNVKPTIVDNIDVKEKVRKDFITVNEGLLEVNVLKKNFVMQNLRGIRSEPNSPGTKDYLQRLEFELSQLDYGDNHVEDLRVTWEQVVTELLKDEDFGQQLDKEISGTEDLLAETARLNTKNEKIKYLYNSVRHQMTPSFDDEIYTDAGVAKLWNKKEGNAAEINLMLINLLNKAGVKTLPILLSTRENGILNPSFTLLKQFNSLMAYVPLDKGFLVLDANDKSIPFGLMPRDIVNTKGFIVSAPGGRWIDLIDNQHHYQVMSAIQETMDINGLIKGEATITFDDYAKAEHKASYTSHPENYKADYFTKPYTAIQVEKIEMQNEGNDSLSFITKIGFNQQLSKTGDYYYFNANVFSDFVSSPFLEEERQTDIDYGVQKKYTTYTLLTIPAEFEFESYPKTISVSTKDRGVSFTRQSDVNNNKLVMKIDITFKRTFYSPDIYPDFKEFYKTIINDLNEQIVVKKKK
ncbi:MAG: DUF3857 domain-containing protein [Ferruginibacter sp.]